MSYFDDNEDSIIFGRGQGLRRERAPQTFSCPDCGTPGLEWTGIGKERYLFKRGLGRHICHVKVLADFDDIS